MLSSEIDLGGNYATIDLTDPPNLQHWITETIRIADTDAGGHINNTALAAYVKSNRVAQLLSAMFDRAPSERWIIAYLEINFRAEAKPACSRTVPVSRRRNQSGYF